MKNLFERITKASGEQWFGFVGLSFLASLCCVPIMAITADHKVRCYYLQTYATGAGIAYTIRQDVDWKDDAQAYTSPNSEDTLEVFATLKQCTGN